MRRVVTLVLGLGLLAAGTAAAAPRNSGAFGPIGSLETPAARGFTPFRPYQSRSPYGGDPTSLAPRSSPYTSPGAGGFKPFQSEFNPYDLPRTTPGGGLRSGPGANRTRPGTF